MLNPYSAQVYNDAVLALTAGFLVGSLFASAALDERAAATVPATVREIAPLRPLPSGT